jgi:energy-coupling factor transporter ATP-binding protein EcfA2
VGDAAHAMSLSYGQATNFALEDAAVLRACLSTALTGVQDNKSRQHTEKDMITRVDQALTDYSEQRVTRCLEMQRRSDERARKAMNGEPAEDATKWIFQWDVPTANLSTDNANLTKEYVGDIQSIVTIRGGFSDCSSMPPQGPATIRIVPSRVSVKNVTHAYPDTLWRKLTSSVPRRPQALSNIQFELESAFSLLTGPSSSGKSALFRMILGNELPSISGSVRINTTVGNCQFPARPVLLDQAPPLVQGHGTPREFLYDRVKKLTATEEFDMLIDALVVSCEASEWMDSTAELSQSQIYVVDIVEKSVMSMTAAYLEQELVPHKATFPAPVLLLDEWLDKETSTVIRNVQNVRHGEEGRSTVSPQFRIASHSLLIPSLPIEP